MVVLSHLLPRTQAANFQAARVHRFLREVPQP